MTAQRIVHRSMQGKEVDMNKLMNQNEMVIAVGNVRVNARGDEIGPGGKIIVKNVDQVLTTRHIPAEIREPNQPNATMTPPVVAEQIRAAIIEIPKVPVKVPVPPTIVADK